MNLLAFLDLACALVSTACAVFVAARDARWRKSGLAKTFSDRLDKAERWHESPEAKVWDARINGLAGRLQAAEERLAHVATREDITRVEGLIGKLDGRFEHVANGIERLEGFFLERGVGAR